jgi:molybdate-binding protein/DNA-binding XRE family transcriptional regulator
MAEIENQVGKLRQKRGFSAIQVAALTGISRQTVYAIEAGTYVPNTVVALKLARALESSVEELFGLPEEAPAPRVETASLLPGDETPQPGQPLQLCRVDEQLVASAPSPVSWYFPPADAVMAGLKEAKPKPVRGRAAVQVFQSSGDFTNRVLVAGCDPGISVLARHVQSSGVELVLAHRNSSQALALLQEGSIHIAGTHLHGGKPGLGTSFITVSFAVWEEGIVTARGNPKGVRGVEDFARKDVSIVNRELGAGCRALLDAQLKKAGIPGARVRGYERTAPGHLPAAWEVQAGMGDCCIATRAAARAFGLGFVSLVSERYDLVIHKKHLDKPAVQTVLDTLSRASFRRELEGLGGYDTRGAGAIEKA